MRKLFNEMKFRDVVALGKTIDQIHYITPWEVRHFDAIRADVPSWNISESSTASKPYVILFHT